MHRNHSYLLKFFFIVNLIFWIQCIASQATPIEKRVALVIGNSAYQNTPPLANPRNDAIEMGKMLKRLGFDVDVVVDATKPQMDQALRRFGNKLEGSSAAVFYYAGHGIQVDGTNYILPIDSTLKNERDLSWEASDLTTVLKQMEGHNRVNLLFLDACRDNPLSQTLARGMGESRSSSIGRGLAPMKANAGTLISYSTKEGEVAADGKGKHSPYTEALLKNIETPGVEIGLMLRKVREEVIAATKNKQVPWEYGSLLGEFYFTGPVTIQVQPKADKSTAGSKNDSLYWESIMNDTDTAAFEEYLKKYPNGEFVEIAKRKIDKLKKSSTKPPPVDAIPQSDQTKPSGSLKMSSDPSDALVLMDGKPIGNTDMEISGIEIGKRKIELKKDCFETKTTEVFIKADQQVRLNLKLKPSCGAMSVTSNPAGADIHLNEKLMGVTPVELAELKEGMYAISLKKEGYEDWKDTATVKAGKTVFIKADKFKPAVIAKLPAQQPVFGINPQVAEQKSSEIHFTVEATPSDSSIKILNIRDKYQKGMVLKPGKYQIEVFREGYETFFQWITMDQSDVVLPVALTPLQKGSLRVTGEPSDAVVYIDKKRVGSLPVELSGVLTGSHQITVKKDGHTDYDETVTVLTGKTTTVTSSLKPLSKYTKLDSSDRQLPDNAQSWMMVRDNETGLIWEIKQNKDGFPNHVNPNDADNTYTWAESTQKFIMGLNAAHFGGFSDWRLPTTDELKTLVDTSRAKPAINIDYFPDTQSSFYWSTSNSLHTIHAWGVYFHKGYDGYGTKSHGSYTRAVRGGR